MLSGPHHADLRDGVDADRKVGRHRPCGGAEGAAGGEPSLLTRRGGETRISDDVAHREDVRDGRPELGIDGEPSAVVRGEARVFESQVGGGAAAPDGEQHGIGDNAFAGLQSDRDTGG